MDHDTLDASLVRIRTIGGEVVGAGFLVGDRQMLTCAHVIVQALGLSEAQADLPLASIVLDFPLLAPHLRLAARVVSWQPVKPDGGGDIAVLELLGDPPIGARPVHFSLAKDVWGHAFRAFGFPRGQDEGVWATGQMLGRQANNWLLLEDVKTEGFAVIPGFSGGPVWDTQLQGVIGMIVAASGRTETKAAFVIPFDVLASAWPCLQPTSHQRVFLSAAPGDKAFAERLSADLRAEEIVVWDESHGPADASPDAQERLKQAIRDAEAVLLIASPQARTSYTVKEHLRLADLYQRRLILTWVGGGKSQQPPFVGWPNTTLVDAQHTPYETALKQIEGALNQRQSRTTLFEPSEEEGAQEPRNPYKGLRPFIANDVGDFFGRERLVNDLTNDIAALLAATLPGTESERCLTILGPSGSGKSSVVMAGLLPHLQSGALPGSETWTYLDPMVPGKHPLDALAHILRPHLHDRSFKAVREDLDDDAAQGLHLLTTELLKERGGQVVLLVDQFEELFTQTEAEAERQRFLNLLLTAATAPSGPLFVLLTLRADFYDRPMQYPLLSHVIQAHQRQVLPMEAEDLRATIERPAALPDVHLSFEGNLVGDLLFEVQGHIGALPLLQFTLDRLFEQREGRRLTLQAYHKIGGIKGALSHHTEQTYTALPSEKHRSLARTLFLRLLEPGTDQQGTTRRRAALSEFTFEDPEQTRLMRETIDAFIAARLLTASETGGITTVEVSHEAVIREWQRLAGWLAEARGDIQVQQTLSADVARWEHYQRPKERLYRGVQLKEAQTWAGRNKPSEQEAAFLRASVARRTFSRVSFTIVSLLLVLLVGFAGWQGWQYKNRPDSKVVTRLQDNVEGSLRWCINNADPGSTIRFDSGLKGTLELTGGDLTIPGGKQFTLAGPGTNQLTITGGNRNAHILVAKGAKLTLSDLSFKNSQTQGNAFLSNQGTLVMTRSVISGNQDITGITSLGGGIYNVGVMTVTDNTFSNNVSNGGDRGQGGGIDNEGTLTVLRSTFLNNRASSSYLGFGGGIYNHYTGIMTVSDSTFSNNSASGQNSGVGGSIDNEGKLTVLRSTFSNNKAKGSSVTGFGGGINNYKTGTVTVNDSTFSGNSASGKLGGYGGGIDNDGMLTVRHSTFAKDSANSSNGLNGHGGGIHNYKTGTVTVSDSTFSGNSASAQQNNQDGAINNDGGKLTTSHDTFSDTVVGGQVVPQATFSPAVTKALRLPSFRSSAQSR